jgi:uncharacterized protein (TIGR04141 family)
MANPPLAPSRQSTLYQLTTKPDLDAVTAAFQDTLDRIDADGGKWRRHEIAGCPALVIYGTRQGPPGWLPEAESMAGMPFSFDKDSRSWVLLVLIVDQHVYALGFNSGHTCIPPRCKSAGFGLDFAVRVADPECVRGMVRRRLGQSGRIDSTLSAGGLPFWAIPFNEHQDLVVRLGSKTDGLELTFGRGGERRVQIDGGIGLKTRFGTRPEQFVADIREIASILETRQPIPELAFIDRIRPVQDPELRESLDVELDALLASEAAAIEAIELAVPEACLDVLDRARSADIRIGTRTKPVEEVTLEAIIGRANAQRAGRRASALRDGHITLYSDHTRADRLARTSALSWIETSLSRGPRRYHLAEGAWFEFDSEYADRHDDYLLGLMTEPGGIELPPWPHWKDEDGYLKGIADPLRMTVLDKKFVRPSGGGQIEICDILGPGGELIHVKQAKGTSSLSHLFAQAINSADALGSSEVRERFAAVVEEHGKGRTVPVDFQPRKVVLAFRHRNGRRFSLENLFPFAKIALADTARRLQDKGIIVQIEFIDTVEREPVR